MKKLTLEELSKLRFKADELVRHFEAIVNAIDYAIKTDQRLDQDNIDVTNVVHGKFDEYFEEN